MATRIRLARTAFYDLHWLWQTLLYSLYRLLVILPLLLVTIPPILGAVLLLGGLALLYPVARVYIIVECFINLVHLPPAVYQEPNWSQYIPHFGSG